MSLGPAAPHLRAGRNTSGFFFMGYLRASLHHPLAPMQFGLRWLRAVLPGCPSMGGRPKPHTSTCALVPPARPRPPGVVPTQVLLLSPGVVLGSPAPSSLSSEITQLSPLWPSIPLDGKNQVWQHDVIPILVHLLKDNVEEVQANAAGALMYAMVTTQGEVASCIPCARRRGGSLQPPACWLPLRVFQNSCFVLSIPVMPSPRPTKILPLVYC